MAVQVTLVVGRANSGKSTTIRCLTGKGQDSNVHPTCHPNVLTLKWQTGDEKTLVLQSSLNEGQITAPCDLFQLLTKYEQACKATRAILAISLSHTGQCPAANYAALSWGGANHVLTHLVWLRPRVGYLGAAVNWPALHTMQFPYGVINARSRDVRQFVGLI